MSSDPMHPYETYGGLLSLRNRPPVVQGVAISAWKSNERAPRCGICVKKFGFMRRRHHCRACGDVCCRGCLGFLLVDVPLAGVDISYTCLRCITRHNTNPSIRDDIDLLARSVDTQCEPTVVRSRRAESTPMSLPSSLSLPSYMATPPTSALNSPMSVADYAFSPTASASPRTWATDYKVTISQSHNHKLHSVCSLLGDYLECKGGAVVLMDETDVWVLAHKGLRTSAMQSPNFLSLCHHAMKSKEVFTASRDRKKVPPQHQEVYRFFGAAPIFQKDKQFTPIGCVVALDTNLRDEPTSKCVKKTLENLARLVTNVLADEDDVMRMYASGEFKHLPSGSTALPTMNTRAAANVTSTLLDRFGVESPLSSPRSVGSPHVSASAVDTSSLRHRSRSFIIGDNATFYDQYAGETKLGSALRFTYSSSMLVEPKQSEVGRAPAPLPPKQHGRAEELLRAA